MSYPWKIIKELESDNSRLFKEGVIEKYINDKDFQEGLAMCLDPLVTFGVKQVPESDHEGGGLDWNAFKEAVNQLSLALNHGKNHPNRCLWIIMMAMARYSFGNFDEAVELAFDAVEALGEPEFKPQIRSATTVELMIRNYATLEDVPPLNTSDVNPIARARMLICLLLGIGSVSMGGPFRKIATTKYGLQPSNIKLVCQWYHQKAFQMSYEQ